MKLLVYFSSFQCSPFDFQSLISLQPTIINESSVASFIVVNASYQWPYAAVRSLFAVDLAQQLSAWRFLERCSSRRGDLETWTKFRKNFRERVSRFPTQPAYERHRCSFTALSSSTLDICSSTLLQRALYSKLHHIASSSIHMIQHIGHTTKR